MRPIVLIPGIGGSILVNKNKPTRTIMRKELVHNRWLNIYPFFPRCIEEWKSDMKCDITRTSCGKVAGVKPVARDITILDFGGTCGIKNMLPEFLLLPENIQDIMQNAFQFRYYNELCDDLYSFGYKDHESLFGIPYDFRLVLDPDYRTELFQGMKHIIEKAKSHNNQQCVVATHSLGCLMFKWFLSSHVDPEWVKSHIYRLFMLSPPFGGSLYSLKTVMSGDFYIPHFHGMYKDELQTNTGIVMCLPNRFGFDPTYPLMKIEEPQKSVITLGDYSRLYQEGHVSFQIWQDLYLPHVHDIYRYVDVDCHIINAINRATPISYTVRQPGKYPHKESHSDGDGIIIPPDKSVVDAMFPLDKLRMTTLKECKHTEIITHSFVVRNILESALND